MSDKECRKTCDVNANWLKAGDRTTELEAELAKKTAYIELHAGDCRSLNTDISELRDTVDELEAELARGRELVTEMSSEYTDLLMKYNQLVLPE